MEKAMIEILSLLSLVFIIVLVALAVIILFLVRRQGTGMDRLRGGSAETQLSF